MVQNPIIESAQRAPTNGACASKWQEIEARDAQMALFVNIDFGGVLLNYPVITVKEAATDLKCSDQHVRNLIDEGKLLAFSINVAPCPRRVDFRIVRASIKTAFVFQTREQRLAFALEKSKTVDAWLFAPYDPDIGAWQPALRIGSRSSLTINEAAAALRCSGVLIRDLVNTNVVHAHDIALGNLAHFRLARAALVAFVAARLARQNNITI